jgi:hypothetical protein
MSSACLKCGVLFGHLLVEALESIACQSVDESELMDERDMALAWKADAIAVIKAWDQVGEKLGVGALTANWELNEIGRSRVDLALDRVSKLLDELERLRRRE